MDISTSRAMKKKINTYIKKWERQGYPEGIPDEAPETLENANKVPSYRKICKAILKNDVQLISLGYTREPCRIYNSIKKKELIDRGAIKVYAIQYGLWGDIYECV